MFNEALLHLINLSDKRGFKLMSSSSRYLQEALQQKKHYNSAKVNF